MKKFWGYASNGEFSVGCTGQTVYLYNKAGIEIAKFKDIIYAYTPMFSPNGKLFVVKSTDGRLAAYSLKTLSLIKKFRFSKVNGAQDDGFCFSPDGKLFVNLEKHYEDSLCSVSFYDTADFSLANRYMIGEETKIVHIEYDADLNAYYILGFKGFEIFPREYFIAVFENGQIKNPVQIDCREHASYNGYFSLKRFGFTEKSFEWSFFKYDSNYDRILPYELNALKTIDLTLAKLYEKHSK